MDGIGRWGRGDGLKSTKSTGLHLWTTPWVSVVLNEQTFILYELLFTCILSGYVCLNLCSKIKLTVFKWSKFPLMSQRLTRSVSFSNYTQSTDLPNITAPIVQKHHYYYCQLRCYGRTRIKWETINCTIKVRFTVKNATGIRKSNIKWLSIWLYTVLNCKIKVWKNHHSICSFNIIMNRRYEWLWISISLILLYVRIKSLNKSN